MRDVWIEHSCQQGYPGSVWDAPSQLPQHSTYKTETKGENKQNQPPYDGKDLDPLPSLALAVGFDLPKLSKRRPLAIMLDSSGIKVAGEGKCKLHTT